MRKNILHILFIFLLANGLFAQNEVPKAYNGWQISPHGRLHIFVIYAELKFDSIYSDLNPLKSGDHWEWPGGKMPNWHKKLISSDTLGDGFMTQYFREASFGDFQVTGDYLDTLITVPISSIRNKKGEVVTRENFASGFYKNAVIDRVNAMDTLPFAGESRLESFDRWTFTGAGMEKKREANGKIDLVMIIWRNLHVGNMGNHSGYVQTGSAGAIRGLQSDMFSQFRTSDFIPSVIMRHEFSHTLYGGNNFHTAAAGVGQRTFMGSIGGYSNMSAAGGSSPTWNAWDRERMGWKNPDHEFLLSARTLTGEEFNTDLSYNGQLPKDGIFVLRDFITAGDVVRIRLPHIPGGVKQQYLWLENHQRIGETIDHDKALPKGLYAYITAGKDDLEGNNVYGGTNNYLWPVLGIGNYDFGYDRDSSVLILEDKMENPFTGYHFHMFYPMDTDGDDKIRLTTDQGTRSEYFLPKSLVMNGDTMPESYFSYMRYPIFGTLDVPFTPANRRKMGISYNPAVVPLYSYASPGGPGKDDNRTIYLNGISVEVLDMVENGAITIKVRWNDFDIVRDVRWCGNISSRETLNVHAFSTVLVDQGRSPQLAAKVQEINGEAIFAEPSILILQDSSITRLGPGTRIRLRAGSTLLIRKGAQLNMGRNARIIAEKGCYVYIEEGAQINLEKRANFEMMPGSSSGVHPLLTGKLEQLAPMAEIPQR